MTHSPCNLEDLQLLREARLPLGFEEHLRERLAAAASEKKVLRFGSRRRPHGWLLLAAIAIPVAALAAGGVVIAQRIAEPGKQAVTTGEAKRPLEVGRKASSLPVATPTPVPSESTRVDVAEEKPQTTKRERGTTSKSNSPSRANAAARKVEAAPAKIESLELSLPKPNGATNSVVPTKSLAKSSDLRGAVEREVVNRSPVERENERALQNREQAGERRGSDAAQQSRERVRARERKGQ